MFNLNNGFAHFIHVFGTDIFLVVLSYSHSISVNKTLDVIFSVSCSTLGLGDVP